MGLREFLRVEVGDGEGGSQVKLCYCARTCAKLFWDDVSGTGEKACNCVNES
jgi:hypothetical protein